MLQPLKSPINKPFCVAINATETMHPKDLILHQRFRLVWGVSLEKELFAGTWRNGYLSLTLEDLNALKKARYHYHQNLGDLTCFFMLKLKLEREHMLPAAQALKTKGLL